MTAVPAQPASPSARRATNGAGAGAPVVAAQGLTKVFKDFWMRPRARAVDNISFQVLRGEVFGLLGPNGSGKSTTIKLLLGLLHRTSGRLAVFGKLPTDVAVKKRIGYLPEESHLYPFLNARETLEYYAKLFELDHRVRARRVDELLDMVGLAAVQRRQVREYSKGMQRRIGIAQALINDPEFLILDEPTTGLDPLGTRQIKDLILELARRGKTILLSSHLLADVEDCVDRLVILYGGKIRAEGTCDSLLTARDRTLIETDALDDSTIRRVEELLRTSAGAGIRRVNKPRQRLEDLFLEIVERAREERLETSGAQAGGPTAGFLRGEGDGESGAALVARLTRDEPAGAAPTTPRAPVREPESDAARSIVESLTGADRSAPAPGAGPSEPGRAGSAQGGPAGDRVPTTPDADRTMIERLLASDAEPRRPPPPEGTEPRP